MHPYRNQSNWASLAEFSSSWSGCNCIHHHIDTGSDLAPGLTEWSTCLTSMSTSRSILSASSPLTDWRKNENQIIFPARTGAGCTVQLIVLVILVWHLAGVNASDCPLLCKRICVTRWMSGSSHHLLLFLFSFQYSFLWGDILIPGGCIHREGSALLVWSTSLLRPKNLILLSLVTMMMVH